MMPKINRKVAIVTGGNSGIGGNICYQFVLEGMVVVAASRGCKDEELNENRYSRQCDVRDPDSIKSLVDGVMEEFGRIDVLVNSAGVATTTSLEDISLDEWNNVMSTNLTGAFLMCQAVIPHMVQAEKGRVINIGSIAGLKRSKTASVAYTCSKYGMTGLTKQLAPTYAGNGITINCLCPSQTLTDMFVDNVSADKRKKLMAENPTGRLGYPCDISGMAYFLTTDHAEYINGEAIAITGGVV